MILKKTRLCFIGNMLGKHSEYSNTQGEILADLFASEGYEVTRVSSKTNRFARLSEIVLTLIKKKRQFDLVFLEVYSGFYFIIADVVSLICRIFKLPLIMVLHGGALPEFIQNHPNWTKRVLNRADILVAPSKFLAEKIENWGYNISVVPNVVDLNRYPYKERNKILPNLIWMRSFHPIYNPEMAIKVLAKLRENYPEATLTMAGADKGLENRIKQMVEEMGLSDAVRFAGFLNLEKKIKEFSAADIYLNTNRVDNMPVSVVEARALGLPVVATNVGGLSYLVNHDEDGLLVPCGDVNLMVESIEVLLKNPEQTQKISQNGRSLAENSAWTSVFTKWEILIQETLKKKSKNKVKFRAFEI